MTGTTVHKKGKSQGILMTVLLAHEPHLPPAIRTDPMDPTHLYGASFSIGIALALVSKAGEVCLLERSVAHDPYSQFHGLATYPTVPDPAAKDLERAAWEALQQQLGSSHPRELVPLGRVQTPEFTQHRTANLVFLVKLEVPSELSQGRWWNPEDGLSRWGRGELLLEPAALEVLRYLTGKRDFSVPQDRVLLHPGALMLPLRTPTIPPATHTNCYLFGHEAMIAVDPASPYPEEQARLHDILTTLSDAGRHLTAIVLTHHHPDHVGGAAALAEAFQVPILAHADTVPLVQDHLQVDEVLKDGDEIETDCGALTALFTPGHAHGHLALWDARRRHLITGDMLAGWGTILVAPPEGNMATYVDSLRRLRALEPRLLLPAHGPPIGAAREKIDGYIAHREGREKQVLEALSRGPMTPGALVSRIYVGLPSPLRLAAEGSMLAHLFKLQGEGRVAEDGGRFCLESDGVGTRHAGQTGTS